MTRRRFVVLDRDGTLIVERNYLSDPCQVEVTLGATRALRQLNEMGLGLVVITNQSGIGRGFFDEKRLGLIHQRLCDLLATEGIHLDGIYFCPHLPQDGCPCRKPRPGLLELAARELDFDPCSCFVIGDRSTDIELGKMVGATTFLVRGGYGELVVEETQVIPDYVVHGMGDAAQVIEGLLHPPRPAGSAENPG